MADNADAHQTDQTGQGGFRIKFRFTDPEDGASFLKYLQEHPVDGVRIVDPREDA